MPRKCTNLVVAIFATQLIGNAVAEQQREEHMHQSFAKDVDALHAVLAPLWHARAGKERSLEACANANKMERLARDIHTGDTKALLAAIAALEEHCQKSRTDIDAALSDVHEAFHHLAEATDR
jgi:hypothetical protein